MSYSNFMIFVSLIILLTSSPSQALMPPPAPSVIVCVNFEPNQISLSESNIKRIENFTNLITRVHDDLTSMSISYEYHIQPNSNIPPLELAIAREKKLLNMISNRIENTDIANIPLSFYITPHDYLSLPNCEVKITAEYFTNKASELLCQPSSDFCSYVKCDDKGCAE